MLLLINYLETLALICSIINYKKFETKALKGFLFLLMLTNIVEWGNFYRLFAIKHSTNWVANIRNPIEFIFIGWFYSTIINNTKIKLYIKWLNWFIIVTSVINLIFFQGFYYLDSYTIILGSCFCLYYIIVYLIQLMKTPNIPNLLLYPYFWISVGFLFFYTGQSILLSFFQYFLYINDFSSFRTIWYFFIILINIILYSCLSIAFFCRLKPTNTLLQE